MTVQPTGREDNGLSVDIAVIQLPSEESLSVAGLIRHGLLRLRAGDDEHWEFNHALAYRFARETRREHPELLDRRHIEQVPSWS